MLNLVAKDSDRTRRCSKYANLLECETGSNFFENLKFEERNVDMKGE